MSTYKVTFQDESESLSHFGIKGMKWGVRRYQNPDGSLTPEGKARYNYNSAGGAYVDITGSSRSGQKKISIGKKKQPAEEKTTEELRKEVLSDPKKLAKELYNPKYEFTQKELEDAIRIYERENRLLRTAKERGALTKRKNRTSEVGEKISNKFLEQYSQQVGAFIGGAAAAGTIAALKKYGPQLAALLRH